MKAEKNSHINNIGASTTCIIVTSSPCDEFTVSHLRLKQLPTKMDSEVVTKTRKGVHCLSGHCIYLKTGVH